MAQDFPLLQLSNPPQLYKNLEKQWVRQGRHQKHKSTMDSGQQTLGHQSIRQENVYHHTLSTLQELRKPEKSN